MTAPSARSRLRASGLPVVTALIAPLALLAQPLFEEQIVPHWDYNLHLRWAGEFATTLNEGVVFPRWAFAAHGGLGDPTFLYYQPLLYYISSAFVAAGSNVVQGLLWAASLPFVFLGIITARLLRQDARPVRAAVAVAFVVASPAPLFLYSQAAAFPWVFGLPFAVLFVVETMRRRPRIGRSSAWFALLCLSHILSGLIVLMVMTISRFVLFGFLRKTRFGHLRFIASLALGVALANFYVFPALTLQAWITPDAWQDSHFLDWHRGFAFPTWSYALYGWNWFSLQLPIPLLAVGMSAFVLLSRRGSDVPKRCQILASRLAIVSLVASTLSSELAYPLFSAVGPVQRLQHPYRFAVLGAVLAGVAFALQSAPSRRILVDTRRLGHVGLAMAAISVVMTLYLELSVFRDGTTSPTYVDLIKDDFGQAEYLPATSGSRWRDYVSAGGFTADCRRHEIVCERTSPASSSFHAQVEAAGPVRLRLPIFAFPGWQTRVDGIVVPTWIDAATGVIAVDIAEGRSQIDVQWHATPAEWIGRALTLAALAYFVARRVAQRGCVRPRWIEQEEK